MWLFDILRLRQQAPTTRPPKGYYDLRVSKTAGQLVLVDSDGAETAVGAAGAGAAIGMDHAVITEATTGRTLALTDAWSYIRCTNSGAITITIPQEATVAWVAGTEIYVRRAAGAGAISLAGSGVTVNNGSASTTVDANGTFCIKKVGTDTWDFV